MILKDFYTLFDDFVSSAFRLETLPGYDVDAYEGERLRAFLGGTALPVRSVRDDEWMSRLAQTSSAGKVWRRLRVLDEPLTDYQRFELAVFPETQAVGEEIRVISRRGLNEMGPDVWLFDAGSTGARMVTMCYADDGTWLGVEVINDERDIAATAGRIDEVWSHATPLNEYLVQPRA